MALISLDDPVIKFIMDLNKEQHKEFMAAIKSLDDKFDVLPCTEHRIKINGFEKRHERWELRAWDMVKTLTPYAITAAIAIWEMVK